MSKSRSRRRCALLVPVPYLLLPALFLLQACLQNPNVVRVVDGQEVRGRFIRSDAYALFMEGVVAEQSGHLAAAERLYLEAYRRDRAGAAILVRLGAVRCAWGPKGHEPAERTFEEALELEPTYAPAYAERARCALRRGVVDDAERYARQAMLYAPNEAEVSLLLAEVLEKRGEGEAAARVLDGLVQSAPSDRAWRAIESLARRRGDEARLALVSTRSGLGTSEVDVDDVDEALARGDLSEARMLATEIGLEQGHLAVRAAALGQWQVAREQARVVLAADPGHADATAAWLASPVPQAAFASVDSAIWRRLLRAEDSHVQPGLSELGALVLADAIRRRFGAETASAWLVARGQASTVDSDPLARALRRRLGQSTP